MAYLECVSCGKKYKSEEIVYSCSCGSILDVKYEHEFSVKREELLQRPLGVWRYKEFMPVQENIVSFGEGGTGLHCCKNLGIEGLYVKNEGENPTGSFKDRGMTVGISIARKFGAKEVCCASTGNTSASLAAYAARAGLKCIVIIPKGKIAAGKMAQARAYGAEIRQLGGNFDKCMEEAKKLGESGVYLLNSINPYRLEGQKSIGYEIIDQLGSVDKIFIPVGNAGNISALWKALKEYHELGWLENLPQLFGIQSEGAAPLVEMFKSREKVLNPVEKPESVATAIRIGNPVSWEKAIKAVEESNGSLESVSDTEILEAQQLLAQKEGLFVEPASAAPLAGMIKLKKRGKLHSKERIVCIATGNGLKDPNSIQLWRG